MCPRMYMKFVQPYSLEPIIRHGQNVKSPGAQSPASTNIARDVFPRSYSHQFPTCKCWTNRTYLPKMRGRGIFTTIGRLDGTSAMSRFADSGRGSHTNNNLGANKLPHPFAANKQVAVMMKTPCRRVDAHLALCRCCGTVRQLTSTSYCSLCYSRR